MLVLEFDQEPVVLVIAGMLHPDQGVAAADLVAFEEDLDFAVLDGAGHGRRMLRVVGDVAVCPPVPDDHPSGPILALGNHALEVAVVERVVLDLDGQPAVRGIGGWSPRHRPRLQYAIDFQTQIVVQAGGGVFVNYEDRSFARLGSTARGLRRPGEIPLLVVGSQRFVATGRLAAGASWQSLLHCQERDEQVAVSLQPGRDSIGGKEAHPASFFRTASSISSQRTGADTVG